MNSQFSFIRQCILHTYYVPGTVLDNEDTPGSKTQSLLSSVPPVHSFIHSLPHKHSFVLTLLQSLVYSAIPVISGRTWGMLQASVLFLEPRSRLCHNLCCLQSLTAASSCLMPYLCPQSSGPSRQADRQTTELHSPACSLPSASPLRLFGSTDGAHWLPSCPLCKLASLVLASQWSSPPSGGRRGMIWIPPVPLHIPGTLTCL